MAIVNVGDSQSFEYTGGIQEFIVPENGIYKLYLVGASGNCNRNVLRNIGKGGVTTQYIKLKKGTKLYVVCGGMGSINEGNMMYNYIGVSGGYNGGGGGGYGGNGWDEFIWLAGGGGATHIATASGVLSSLSDNRDSILAVAGGGAGSITIKGSNVDYPTKSGGGGGGLTSQGSTPATQTTGNAFGQGGICSGGGWFGGVTAPSWDGINSGGSSYLSDTTTEYTINGVTYLSSTVTQGQVYNSYNTGYATITFMAKTTPNIIINGVTIDTLIYNGTSVDKIIYNGTEL